MKKGIRIVQRYFRAHMRMTEATPSSRCPGWDTVYNPETGFPMTTVSRLWNRNWGGLLGYIALEEAGYI